jgi:hypothetical protein
MTPHEAVRSLLAQAIGPAVGERIRPDRRYLEDTLPAAAYRIAEAVPTYTLGGEATVRYAGEVLIWSDDRRQAVQLAEAVAAQSGLEIQDDDTRWHWFWTGGSFTAELVEEETDRPEYQATVNFVLWKA